MEDYDKKTYELAFLLENADVEAEVAAAMSQFPSIEIVQKFPPKDLTLAYPIKKHATAQFGWYHLKVLPSDVKPLREALALRPHVLRTLFVMVPAVRQQQPSRKPRPAVEPFTVPVDVAMEPPAKPTSEAPRGTLSNEELEKKLEEILK